MGSSLEPEIRNEATHEIRDQYLSARKAREVLGWQPLYGFEEGLKRTVQWYEAFFEIPEIQRQRSEGLDPCEMPIPGPGDSI